MGGRNLNQPVASQEAYGLVPRAPLHPRPSGLSKTTGKDLYLASLFLATFVDRSEGLAAAASIARWRTRPLVVPLLVPVPPLKTVIHSVCSLSPSGTQRVPPPALGWEKVLSLPIQLGCNECQDLVRSHSSRLRGELFCESPLHAGKAPLFRTAVLCPALAHWHMPKEKFCLLPACSCRKACEAWGLFS